MVEHPLREQFTRQLMLALYRSGRQAEALRVAQDFRTTLRDDFGLEPSGDLRELEAAILEEREELAFRARWRAGARASRRVDAARRDLPAETTPLVGRDDDLELVERLLDDRSHPHAVRPRRRGQDPPRPPAGEHRGADVRRRRALGRARPGARRGRGHRRGRRRARRAATAAPLARRLDRRAARAAPPPARARQLRARARHHQRAGRAGAAVVPATCRCSPPAASRSASRPRWCGRCRRCRCRATPTSR